jgi:hypothetical protein
MIKGVLKFQPASLPNLRPDCNPSAMSLTNHQPVGNQSSARPDPLRESVSIRRRQVKRHRKPHAFLRLFSPRMLLLEPGLQLEPCLMSMERRPSVKILQFCHMDKSLQ